MNEVRITLLAVGDFDAGRKQALEDLRRAAFPPGERETEIPARFTWAKGEWGALVENAQRSLVSYAGVMFRQVTLDGRALRLAGLGGVKTHPDWRRQGLAARAVARIMDHAREQADVPFAMLFCRPDRVAYYASLGWSLFEGEIFMQQPGGAAAYLEAFRGMTAPLGGEAPVAGQIDIRGLPF
jgi:predicted N-acetyltransferase YhbS